MNNFENLVSSTTFIRQRAFSQNILFRNDENLDKTCLEYLKMAHRVAEATVPLMQTVVSVATSNKYRDDPVCNILVDYMNQHIKEEMNHDDWYVNDLKSANLTEDDIFQSVPSPNIATMIGSQYYWVQHFHPVAFMGYITSLEVYPPTEKYVQNLMANSKLPASVFDTLMLHAKIDIKHKQDIIDTYNAMPLTDKHREIVELSAFQTFRYLAFIMEDIMRTAMPAKTKIA